jgi:heavy metal sensor kinase
MKIFRTLRARFALWVAMLLLAALAVFGAYLYVSLARSLAAAIDEALEFNAAQAMAAVDRENNQVTFADSIPTEEDAASEWRERGFTIWIYDRSGTLIQAFGHYRSLPAVPGAIAAAQQQRTAFVTVTEPKAGDTIRIYTAPMIDQGELIAIIQVAHNLDTLQETLNRLLKALLLGAPLLAITAALGSYFLVARALRPIDQLTHTAHRISAENLSARLALPATDDEVGRLATTFDEMLTRLQAAFQREHQFTADASHELRTPLAAMQTILSVVRERPRTPADYEHALDDLVYETERLRALVENLLRLARSDQQSAASRTPIHLSTLLNNVSEAFAPLAESKGLTFTATISAGLTVVGDEDSLIRLVVNLLENAVKYTDTGAITFTAQRSAQEIMITIADTGMGIDAAHLPHIFERFYRAEQSRTSQGAGLGLAIAQEIAQAHGGHIAVSSAPGVGATFTLHLTSAAAPRSSQKIRHPNFI